MEDEWWLVGVSDWYWCIYLSQVEGTLRLPQANFWLRTLPEMIPSQHFDAELWINWLERRPWVKILLASSFLVKFPTRLSTFCNFSPDTNQFYLLSRLNVLYSRVNNPYAYGTKWNFISQIHIALPIHIKMRRHLSTQYLFWTLTHMKPFGFWHNACNYRY